MKRFSLERGRWYACEIIGDEFDDVFGPDQCSYSPIKIHSITPDKSGKRIFHLDFYHANYPEGVQNKSYTLRTIERGHRVMLARITDCDTPRFLQIYDITYDWIGSHFPHLKPCRTDLYDWLDKNV